MQLTAVSVIILLLTLSSQAFSAPKTRWVSDQLPLDMRSGNSNGYRVIKMLEPGTRVTVLRVDDKTKFSEVKLADGSKGWLANQYLMSEPSGREQLAQAKLKIAQLSSGSEPLAARIAELEQQNQQLATELEESLSGRAGAESELARIAEASANALALDDSNKSLMETNQQLQHEIDVLKGENQRLEDSSSSKSFQNGAFAVGFGVLLAIVIPRLSPKRKYNEWR